MLTVGIDLAAEPANTAVATLEWSSDRASLRFLAIGADDDALLPEIVRSAKAGIDCPVGWPEQFVEFLTAYRTGTVAPPTDRAGREWRRGLAYRRTDEAVRAATGLVPLSVATDRIGLTAMRAAGLLAGLAERGHPVDRAGTGTVVEVYPAASLRHWELPHRGYKGTKNLRRLGALVDGLLAAAPWLRLGADEPTCRRSDHALDAVIAALTARAAALGLVTTPPPDLSRFATTEGWIAVPTSPLACLPRPR